MAFRTGQKVQWVGLNNIPLLLRFLVGHVPHLPTNVTFTVAGTYDYGFGRLAIDLIEMPCPDVDLHHRGYISYGFKLVTELKTDTGMAILREILDRESYVIKTPAKA